MQNNMNLLTVPYISTAGCNDRDDILTGAFWALKPNKIVFEPWPGEGIKPEVEFKMVYGDDAIFLKFNVKEKYLRATYKQINEPVYRDSCVEFFIGFEEYGAYYNFEFNALGTPLAGYGINNKERELLEVSLINGIKSIAGIKITDGNTLPFNWELTIVIPFNVFYKHHISTLRGVNCTGNFYKCGDHLPEPHFLCWNNIIADKPNFHLPQYFGNIIFE
jgi:hypothetical protein